MAEPEARTSAGGPAHPLDEPRRLSPLPVRLTVYRQAQATWFGRGFYGHKTACGQTLSPTLMGVAHRSLPCGTKVAFYWHGRTITVPVVDRGPFGAGLSWDLTTAAADALGFTKLGRVTLGAVSLKRR